MYVDEVRDLNIRPLAAVITVVVNTLNAADLAQIVWKLPERGFLAYAKGLAWEGRYDTMLDSLFRYDLGSWTYVIEHRFN